MGASFCHHDKHQLTIISTLPGMRATSLEKTHQMQEERFDEIPLYNLCPDAGGKMISEEPGLCRRCAEEE